MEEKSAERSRRTSIDGQRPTGNMGPAKKQHKQKSRSILELPAAKTRHSLLHLVHKPKKKGSSRKKKITFSAADVSSNGEEEDSSLNTATTSDDDSDFTDEDEEAVEDEDRRHQHRKSTAISQREEEEDDDDDDLLAKYLSPLDDPSNRHKTKHNHKTKKNKKGDEALSETASSTSQMTSEEDDEEAVYNPEAVTDEESVLSMLETEQFGPLLRSLFEQEKEGECLLSLRNFAKRKEKEIEDICNYHYHDFIHSVDELLSMRMDAEQLRKDVVTTNEEIQAAGKTLLQKHEALLEYQVTHQNIEEAIEELSKCVYVLNQCARVNEHISRGKFYPALKILEKLEYELLREVSEYQFARYLESKIPALKQTIKTFVLNQYNEWLVGIREHAKKIGELAMAQMFERLQREEAMKEELEETVESEKAQGEEEEIDEDLDVVDEEEGETQNKSNKTRTLRRRKKKKNAKVGDDALYASYIKHREGEKERNRNSDSERSLFEQVSEVQLTPVYRCVHIFEALHSIDEFRKYYKYTRKVQANVMLQPPSTDHTFISHHHYQPYFHKIAGFFIVEHKILHTANQLITLPILESLWGTVVNKLEALLQEQLTFCKETSVLGHIKDFVFLFAKTMRSYGYEVEPLLDFLNVIRDRFCELTILDYGDEFLNILEKENYHPLMLTTEQEYKTKILNNGLDKAYPHQLTLPQTFPFSSFVPNCISIIKHFIKQFYEFANNTHLSSDVDETVQKATEQLLKFLCHNISKNLSDRASGLSDNISCVVQVIINLPFLGQSCGFIEEYLASFCTSMQSMTHQKVVDPQMFFSLQANAEKRLYEIVDNKIEEFFESLANDWNWTPSAAAIEHRHWIEELFLYLEATLTILEPLRMELRDSITKKAFQTIADSMMGLVVNSPAKRINAAAIDNLHHDLEYAEEKANKSKFSGLQNCFAELRQLINLLRQDSVEEFASKSVRASKYPLLSVPNVLSVLERFETESGLNFFSSRSNRRKSIEALIKSLHEELKSSS